MYLSPNKTKAEDREMVGIYNDLHHSALKAGRIVEDILLTLCGGRLPADWNTIKGSYLAIKDLAVALVELDACKHRIYFTEDGEAYIPEDIQRFESRYGTDETKYKPY